MKVLFCSIILTLSSLMLATAQNVTVRGQVVDANNPTDLLIGALVKMNPSDTAGLKKPGRVVATDVKGSFTIIANKANSKIEITYLGYQPKTISIPAGQKTVNLGQIKMSESGVTINAAVVTAQANIAKISGDTTQFNAAAFKTNPDASSEDLLKKMPGVTTGTDGTLESGGKKITKVTVNGKTYFEDDPTLALKSLPVDAVESIQMYDDKTDDAKFSGFDDGQRERTINIVTKKNVMNSVLGKVYGGYGTDNRYAGGAGINWMTDNHRLVFTVQSNNVNNQGFTLNDISQGGGYGGMRGMRGGGNDLGAFTTSTYGGIMQTNAIGVNYSGDFKDKLKLSANYFFNGIGSDQNSSKTQNYLTMARYYEQQTSAEAYQYSHRFNAKAEWTPNETNRITFRPRVNYSINHGTSFNGSETYAGQGGSLTNSSINYYHTKLDSYNISGDLWWQHRFGKAGRTLSVGGTAYGQKSWGNRSQESWYQSLGDNDLLIPDSLRQIGNIDMSRFYLTGSATYTEPISKRSRLNFNYTINYDRSISDRLGLNYDKALQDYTLLDTTTTNRMARNYTTHTGGLGYNYTVTSKFNLSASVRYQYATLSQLQEFPELADPMSAYGFNAVLPSLFLKFTPNNSHSLNFNYNTNSIFPSISQLQSILDITDILQVSTGNPDLKQSYSHNLSLQYTYNNTNKNVTFFMGGYGTATSDYIANHRRFLTADTIVNGTVIPNGAQYTSPVNLNGYMNARLFTNVTFGIKPIKSNMTIMLMYAFTKSPSIENYIKYMSLSNSLGSRIQLTSNISEKIDFTLSYSPSIRFSNSGAGRFDRYWAHDASVFLNIYLWKGFYVQADGTWRNSYGTQESYSQHYGLLNAAIAQKFLKNKLELKISGYDLLGQNRSFRQSTTDTYTQTNITNVLKRYFMASLTWKIDTRNNKTESVVKQAYPDQNRPTGRPMMMMPR